MCEGRMALKPSLRNKKAPLGYKSFSMRFLEFEIRIFLASLLEATQCAALPKIFERAKTGIASQNLDLLRILCFGRRRSLLPRLARVLLHHQVRFPENLIVNYGGEVRDLTEVR